MPDQKDISQFNKSDKVDHFFLINKCELKLSKKNDEFLAFEFADKKSIITSNLWKDRKEFDTFKNLYNQGKLVGKIVKVLGEVSEFNNNLNVNIDKIRLAEPNDNVSPKDFMMTSDRDIDEMIDELKKWINKISDVHLKNLLRNIFTEDVIKKFAFHPAGKIWHHSYIGGLIEHTLEIISICDLMCKFHSDINKDLLISGAMIHDIGKIIEISSEPGFEYTTEGKLLGHIVIAAMMVEREINKINDFPEDLRVNLLHLLLSHQGKLEQASPVVPKTLESVVLYHADELSAKTNAYKLSLEREVKSPSGWTKFINLAGTELFRHNPQTNSKLEKETLFD